VEKAGEESGGHLDAGALRRVLHDQREAAILGDRRNRLEQFIVSYVIEAARAEHGELRARPPTPPHARWPLQLFRCEAMWLAAEAKTSPTNPYADQKLDLRIQLNQVDRAILGKGGHEYRDHAPQGWERRLTRERSLNVRCTVAHVPTSRGDDRAALVVSFKRPTAHAVEEQSSVRQGPTIRLVW
jgi:hypothetical protein